MSQLYGADVEQLDALAKQLDLAAEHLLSVKTNLMTRVVRNDLWIGPRADGFRSDWSAHHAPAISLAAGLLNSTALSVRANAGEQRRASGIEGPAAGIGLAAGLTAGGAAALGAAAIKPGDGSYYRVLQSDGSYRVEKGVTKNLTGKNFIVTMNANVHGGGDVTHSATFGPEGAKLDVSAKVYGGAKAQIDGKYTINGVTATGDAYAEVEASAEVDAKMALGPDGLSTDVGMHAGVEATIGADGAVEAGGVKAAAHGELGFGLGVTAEAKADVSLDRVKASIEVGAFVGLGGKFKINVDVEPRKVIESAATVAGGFGHFVGHLFGR